MVTDQIDLELDLWAYGGLRFTAFLGGAIDASTAQEVFVAFFGESTQVPNQVPHVGEGVTTFQRLVPPMLQSLTVFAEKLDFEIQAIGNINALSTPQSSDFPPTLSVEGSEFKDFRRRAGDWSSDCENCKRLAVGAQFVCRKDSKTEGYRAMARRLPAVAVDPEESSDFLYRINRPRTAEIGGKSLKINRLCQWSCAYLKVDVEGPSQKSVLIAFAALMNPDVNTPPEVDLTKLDAKNRKILTNLLFDFALEYTVKGDVP